MVRHRRMLAPINSNKYYVHQTIVTVVSGVILNVNLVDAVVAPAAATSFQVEEGSLVKAIWVELWLTGASTAGNTSSFNITLEKIPANQTAMTFTQSANLGAYPNKKNILYTTQGVIGSVAGGQPLPLLRQWFAIPKGKQRMGLSDRIMLNISNQGSIDEIICGIFIYKEYR